MKMSDIYIFNKKGTVNINRFCCSCQRECTKPNMLTLPSSTEDMPVLTDNKPEQPAEEQKLSCIYYQGNQVLQLID